MPSVPERPSDAEACALRAALDEREVAHAMLALARLLKYGAEELARTEQHADAEAES